MIKKLKIKKLLFLFIFAFLFLGTANLVFAVEVQNGPCANSTNLGTCVVSFFKWGIGFAIAVAAASFAAGAIMLMISGDNGELANGGKDRMKGSVLGLVLLGSSFLIMNAINPQLVNPGITALNTPSLPTPPLPPGVYFYADSGCSKTILGQATNSSDIIFGNTQGIKIVDDTTSTNKINYR